MKKKRTIRVILFMCLMISAVVVYGCGSNGYKSSMDAGAAYDSKSNNSSSSQMASGGGMYEGSTEEGAMDDVMEEAVGMDTAGEYLSASTDDAKSDSAGNADIVDGEGISVEGSQSGETRTVNDKLIYTYHYSVETKEFDDFNEKIAAKTTAIGGYIENSETNGSASDGLNRCANMTLRIPADQVHQLLSMLDTESNVTYHSSSVENVSLQYTDLESHIKALRIEQDTLLRLLEQAEELKNIITLQSKLSEVRYEIESYEAQLRLYDNRIDYSTIYLDISEVERTTTVTPARATFGKEVKDRFSDNLYAVGQSLRSFAVWLIGSLPVLVPAAVLLWLLVLLVRRWSRFWKARTAASAGQNAVGYQSIYKKRRSMHTDNPYQTGQQEPGRDAEQGQNRDAGDLEQDEGQRDEAVDLDQKE